MLPANSKRKVFRGSQLYPALRDCTSPTSFHKTVQEPSYYTLDSDSKDWTRKGSYLPRSERFKSPPQRPDPFEDSASGSQAFGQGGMPWSSEKALGAPLTIDRAVKQHPMRYSNQFNSSLPRMRQQKQQFSAHLGPGLYEHDEIAAKEPWRLSSGFSSGSLRLARLPRQAAGENFSVLGLEAASWQKGTTLASGMAKGRRFSKPHKQDGMPGPGAYLQLKQWPGKTVSVSNAMQPVYSVPHSV